MIVNLAVFIYEPFYWRVTAEVVFVVLFPSNRRLFNEIVAYEELFCMVTLLASSTNHDDDKGNLKIKKKKRATSLTDEQEKTPERAAHFLSNFLAIVARVTLSNFIEMAMRSYL